MEKNVTFDASKAAWYVSEEELVNIAPQVVMAKEILVKKTGAGNDFLGWIDLPVKYDKKEFKRILKAADKIRKDSDILLVAGIGGSYLGARAAIEFLKGTFYNNKPADRRGGPEIYFCGNSLSSTYLAELIELLDGKDFSVNVISKSGTTTETSVSFRILKDLLIKKYGAKEAAKRIYATTDKARGALKTEADAEGYETFVIPDDIGGRFSVLTAVGLLPIAASGADISRLMDGAAAMRKLILDTDYESNDCLKYAAHRIIMMRKGKTVELLANYEPSLHYVSEWWKQLQGESEGKDNKGLFPASVDLTTDLHSMGQFIQDGTRLMFETVLNAAKPRYDLKVEATEDDLDGLNYLAGRKVSFINSCAMKGTALAHVDGKVPNLRIDIPEMTEYYLGQLFYFFEFECGVSGYMNAVNPFNQPGVEAYKKNMFKLLGKPGYKK